MYPENLFRISWIDEYGDQIRGCTYFDDSPVPKGS
jgi:hypothetical protein